MQINLFKKKNCPLLCFEIEQPCSRAVDKGLINPSILHGEKGEERKKSKKMSKVCIIG